VITVRLPATLRTGPDDSLRITTEVASIGALIDTLEEMLPGLREQLDDSVFNFAVNDELVLHRARERRLADGDVVEIVPTISGGAR
jgi:molybdopterin converting factor small subunit